MCEKLLKKFLVREPVKRASLDIFIDDPWINESFGNSPITTDIGEVVLEDDEIISIVTAKFKIERDDVLTAIRSGEYNDIAAVYYLLYYETDANRKISLESQDITQVSTRLKGNSAAPNPNMIKIEEDSVIKTEDLPAAPKAQVVVAQSYRKRAQTVGGF